MKAIFCFRCLRAAGLASLACAGLLRASGVAGDPVATSAQASTQAARGVPKSITMGEPALQLTVHPALWQIEVTRHGQRVLLYTMGSNQFKPYVKELYSLKGDNLLLDAPADHLHHHGLMYGIKVNGLNFWEEQGTPGVQLPTTLPARYVVPGPDGKMRATFSHFVHWISPTNRHLRDPVATALLAERRTIGLSVDEASEEIVLNWRSDFQVGAGATEVKLEGAGYHGLGLRFARAFDQKARHLNSGAAPYSAEQKWDVIPGRWAATQHEVEGKPVTVAILASPKNAGPGRFFSMIQPFAYLSATQGLDQTPIEHKRGDKFSLEYRVLTYPAHKDRPFLEGRYQQWVAGMK